MLIYVYVYVYMCFCVFILNMKLFKTDICVFVVVYVYICLCEAQLNKAKLEAEETELRFQMMTAQPYYTDKFLKKLNKIPSEIQKQLNKITEAKVKSKPDTDFGEKKYQDMQLKQNKYNNITIQIQQYKYHNTNATKKDLMKEIDVFLKTTKEQDWDVKKAKKMMAI